MPKKQQTPIIEFLEDSLLINSKILVLSDLHIGHEENISDEKTIINLQSNEILDKLKKIFKYLEERKISIKKIIILGDLKHDFSKISNSEWEETLKLLDYLLKKIKNNKKNSKKLILLKGNHDNLLIPILKKRDLKLKDFHKENKICFLHGNKIKKHYLNSNCLVIGHFHPAITLSDKYKREKFKCFLVGNWKNKKIYVLPSFSQLTIGQDLTNLRPRGGKKPFSIINNKYLKNFNIIIYSDKENKKYNFGKLKNLI